MKLDDTFETVNRIWQELSVIVVLHAAAFGFAWYAGVIRMPTISQGSVSSASLQLVGLRKFLQDLGLDLPLVVGVALVVYVVLFQRLSAAAIVVPPFRLFYSQSSLWRAGKCFDELRQLVNWFEGYTASADLADLEVTLGLAVAQYAKEYAEHHRQLVETRFAAAVMWSRYYSGFCLLAFAAIVGMVVFRPPTSGWIVPAGLFVAACAARCAWEAQIERAVLGRLQFAIDCAIIAGEKARHGTADDAPASIWDDDATSFVRVAERIRAELDELQRLRDDHGSFAEEHYAQAARRLEERRARDLKRLERELALSADLVKLPPPGLPYQHGWLLHYLRQIRPFTRMGALPLRRNEGFRRWLEEQLSLTVQRDPNLFAAPNYKSPNRSLRFLLPSYRRDDPMGLPHMVVAEQEATTRIPWSGMEFSEEGYARQLNALWDRIVYPESVEDERRVARLLRTRTWRRLAQVAPRILLVDEPSRYRHDRHEGPFFHDPVEPFRKWIARVRR